MSGTYSKSGNRKAWDVMLARAKQYRQKPFIDVGFPKDGKIAPPSKQGSGHKPFKNMPEIAFIMAVHEYGRKDGTIPARPFMRPAILFNKSRIAKYQQRIATSVLIGNITVNEGLDRVGKYVVNLIKEELRFLDGPPLKPRTIARKGSEILLIDTKQAYNSIQFTRRNKIAG